MQQENSLGYRKLIVWEKSHELVKGIYRITGQFPKYELFGLISQMRRCAISVPANIVEGYGRKSNKEKLNFLNIAKGSLTELEYYIDLSHELGYLEKEHYTELVSARITVGKLLHGYIKSF